MTRTARRPKACGENGYAPVDISPLCNRNGTLLAGRHPPGLAASHVAAGPLPVGRQQFHGLPFLLGPESGEGASLIAFGPDMRTQPVTIPLASTARQVIVGHGLLDSQIYEGDPVGRACAEYTFSYADSTSETVTIRERFEIGLVPAPWGQLPLLAYPDEPDHLMSRHGGPWGEAGLRAAEVVQGWPRWFYLWPWENPRPGAELASLTIKPLGPRFYLAAVTVSHLDEHPFVRTAKRAVKIVLGSPEDASSPFALEIAVDRGVAGYPYPLPTASPAEFLAAEPAGFGEPENHASGLAYAEVAAVPSATVEVALAGESLGSARWSELVEKGAVDVSPRLTMILVDEGRNWVRTTVLDADSAHPLPCRIHFRSRDGIPYQPTGHHNHVNSNLPSLHMDVGGDVRLGQVTYAYIDGRCEGWLPRGEVIVDVACGFEYEPLRRRVTIEPGQTELTLRLERAVDLRKEHLFAGDTHVHFLSTEGAHLEAAGEGVRVVNLLLTQLGHLFAGTEEFTGRPSVRDSTGTIVYASQENRQHMLGHLSLLGLKQLVAPWSSDGPAEADLGGNLETTLSRWADACHAQGGTVIVPHLPNPNGEPAALIASERADAVEWLIQSPYQHLEYYRYLNCGYRLPLVGGTDKMTSDVPLGLFRTYVQFPDGEPVTYEAWCRHLRAGRTFVSSGPLLRLRVEGEAAGSVVTLTGRGGTVGVEARVDSVFPVNLLEIVVNGEVAARAEVPDGTKQLTFRENLKIDCHSWVAARCGGPGYFHGARHHDGWRRGVMAHTSPVYVAVGGEWHMFDAGAASYLLTLLEGGIEYMRTRARQWPESMVTHHHGREDHLAFLEEPFQEAIAAVHERMHRLGVPH